MDSVERLSVAEEIRLLKARYFRLLDSRCWAEFEALFAADATFDMRKAAGGEPDESALIVGAPAIAAFVRNAVNGMATVHHGHMPEIEVLSRDSVQAIWAMEDLLQWRDEKHDTLCVLHGYGHYRDHYARVDGRWVIQSSVLSRLVVNVSPGMDTRTLAAKDQGHEDHCNRRCGF